MVLPSPAGWGCAGHRTSVCLRAPPSFLAYPGSLISARDAGNRRRNNCCSDRHTVGEPQNSQLCARPSGSNMFVPDLSKNLHGCPCGYCGNLEHGCTCSPCSPVATRDASPARCWTGHQHPAAQGALW